MCQVSWYTNHTRNCVIFVNGKGAGSTQTLSYGPGKKFATMAQAQNEAGRLVKAAS